MLRVASVDRSLFLLHYHRYTLNYKYMSFKNLSLIAFVFLFITSPFLAFASGSKTITRGDAVTITWEVTGATSCSPDTSYPKTAGDNVWDKWNSIGQTTSGSTTFDSVYQPNPSGYVFSCKNIDYGIVDQITLYVNDCPATAPWDTTNTPYACVNPIPSVSISPNNAQTIVLGASVAYASTVTDTGGNDPSALRASPLLHRGDKV